MKAIKIENVVPYCCCTDQKHVTAIENTILLFVAWNQLTSFSSLATIEKSRHHKDTSAFVLSGTISYHPLQNKTVTKCFKQLYCAASIRTKQNDHIPNDIGVPHFHKKGGFHSSIYLGGSRGQQPKEVLKHLTISYELWQFSRPTPALVCETKTWKGGGSIARQNL